MENNTSHRTLSTHCIVDRKTGMQVAPTPKSTVEGGWMDLPIGNESIRLPVPQLGHAIRLKYSGMEVVFTRGVSEENLHFLNMKFAKIDGSSTEEEVAEWWMDDIYYFISPMVTTHEVTPPILRLAEGFYYGGLARGGEVFTRPYENFSKLISQFTASVKYQHRTRGGRSILPFFVKVLARIQALPMRGRASEWEKIKFVLLLAMTHSGMSVYMR